MKNEYLAALIGAAFLTGLALGMFYTDIVSAAGEVAKPTPDPMNSVDVPNVVVSPEFAYRIGMPPFPGFEPNETAYLYYNRNDRGEFTGNVLAVQYVYDNGSAMTRTYMIHNVSTA